jgi:hypothetical protein
MQTATHDGARNDANPTLAADGTPRDDPDLRARHDGNPGRSLGHLFSQLWRDTTLLVQQEAALAKADMSDKLSQILAGSGAIVGGAAIVFIGLIALMLSAVNALLPYLPIEQAPWLSPLLVGVVVMIVGFILFASGRNELRAKNLAPSRSVESLRRDSRLVKEHLQ